MKNQHASKWLFIPAFLIGFLVLFLMIKNRSQPEVLPVVEQAYPVNFIHVSRLDATPAVTAKGNVLPSDVWRGVAQVNGEVISVHPRLKTGSIIGKDELIITLDAADYEYAVDQAKSELLLNSASRDELIAQESNSEALLNVEKKSLKLAKKELQRKQKMFNETTISRADLEKEERNYLNQQKNILSLENTLKLYPIQKQKLDADRKRLRAKLETARLNINRTKIAMPITGRLSQVNVEQNQFVRQGELLVQVDGVEKAEIEVPVPITEMSNLVRRDKIIDPLNMEQMNPADVLGIQAEVFIDIDDRKIRWPAKVARISETMDTITQTVGLVVEVDEPYKGIIPGVRPPLLKGMFVNVRLKGQVNKNSLIVPAHIVENAKVLVIDDENRLQSKTVKTGIRGEGFIIIKEGLQDKERVIVSDVSPAISGMLLTPFEDQDMQNRLAESVRTESVEINQ